MIKQKIIQLERINLELGDIPSGKIIEDFETIPFFLHKQRLLMLKLLLKDEYTIIDLKEKQS